MGRGEHLKIGVNSQWPIVAARAKETDKGREGLLCCKNGSRLSNCRIVEGREGYCFCRATSGEQNIRRLSA